MELVVCQALSVVEEFVVREEPHVVMERVVSQVFVASQDNLESQAFVVMLILNLVVMEHAASWMKLAADTMEVHTVESVVYLLPTAAAISKTPTQESTTLIAAALMTKSVVIKELLVVVILMTSIHFTTNNEE
mmetsp:Transcript_30780/g.47918  ORF Transcript_30780/g.47918 Transcript_30780/m.47918 type:complete len:133 (-) Transcript_30780:25-423(-)